MMVLLKHPLTCQEGTTVTPLGALHLEGGCEVCSSRSAGVRVYTWLDCGELGGHRS